jgi:hypothetical protein
MLTQRLANIVFAILLIIACGWFAWIAQEFKAAGLLASSGLPSKFFPQLTLACTALCAAVVVYQYGARGESGGDAGEHVFRNGGDAMRGVLMMVVAVGCYFIWKHFGFIPMAVAMGPLSLIAMGIRQPVIYLVVLIITVAVYFVFTRLLNVQLA